MNKFKAITTALVTSTVLLGASFSSFAMDKNIETALVNICKAAKTDSVLKLKHTTESYRLKEKTVALKVMCNGNDIIAFAEKNGAYKTAGRLERQLSSGSVNIIDVAAISKINVTFEE